MSFDIKDASNGLHWFIGGISSLISYAVGGYDGAMLVFVAFMILDLVTGVAAGAYNSNLSSRRMFRGVVKKGLLLSIVAVFAMLDLYIFHANGVIRWAALVYMIGSEGVSILENAANCGVPVPKKLFEILTVLQKKVEEIEIPGLELPDDDKEKTDEFDS